VHSDSVEVEPVQQVCHQNMYEQPDAHLVNTHTHGIQHGPIL
jgi:hypothetical protein